MTNTQRAKGDRSTVVAAFAVLATVIALIVTTWFTNKANREQLRVTEDGQITDRYSAAVDQLGHLDLDVRLGGIYALERIMRDSEPDQATIVAVLFAYVRDQTRPDRSCPEGLDHPATDVQAALTVVGRRDAKRDNNRVKSDLSGACLIGADLSGADLTGVAMIGTDLTCAHLMGANLHRAKITSTQMGDVNLTNATLTEATLTDVVLNDAVLTKAILTDASLIRVDLARAKVSEQQLAAAKPITIRAKPRTSTPRLQPCPA